MVVEGITYGRILNYYAMMSREAHIPFYGSFELTPRCNMNCKMCYIRMTPEEMKKVGSELSGDEWLRIAKEAVDKGMMNVLLTGGEAVLHPDFKKIYLALRKMGVFVTVNTNATVLNDSWIDFFDQNRPSQINVTVYGGSNETYARLCRNPKGFDQMKNEVEKLLKKGINVKLNCVISKQNVEDIAEIYKFGREHDLKITSTAYCFPPVRKEGVIDPELNRFDAKEAAKARIKLHWEIVNDKTNFYKDITTMLKSPGIVEGLEHSCVDAVGDKVLCAAGRSNFWVTWDGRMLPCGMIPDFSVPIKNRPFIDAWKEIVEYTEKITLAAECKNCPKKDMCSPCAAKLKSETGVFDKKAQYLCDYVDEYIRLMGEAKKYLEKN